MKTYKRTQQWFRREYKYLRGRKDLMTEKTEKSESYFTGSLIYDLYFDGLENFVGSMVSDSSGVPIASYVIR